MNLSVEDLYDYDFTKHILWLMSKLPETMNYIKCEFDEVNIENTVTINDYYSIKMILDILEKIIIRYEDLDFFLINDPNNEEIREMIINTMGRGVTVYSGKKGYGKRGETKETDIVYTVITRLELNKLMTELDKISPSAFVVMNSVKDTRGGMIKKRPLKH